MSLVFTVGTQVSGAGPLCGALVAAAQSQSEGETFSFGEGRFFIDGKAARAFTEFEFLYLEGGSLKLSPDKKRIVAVSAEGLKGELYKGRRTFKLKKAAMVGDALTFESQAISGTSFQFSGSVFNAATAEDNESIIGIKGRLSKFLNGKKVSEAQVTFSYLEPTD
jgi:hypothetical protein